MATRYSAPRRYLEMTYTTEAAHDPGWPFSRSMLYGYVRWEGRNQRVHRVAWTLAHGPVPDGLWVLHRCDTPACFFVEHLFLGTQVDNMRDMVSKGRAGGGKLYPPGELNPNAVLSAAQVREIRARYTAGGIRQQDLATEYGVSRQCVGDLLSGRRRASDV